jgi:hypothetical protein
MKNANEKVPGRMLYTPNFIKIRRGAKFLPKVASVLIEKSKQCFRSKQKISCSRDPLRVQNPEILHPTILAVTKILELSQNDMPQSTTDARRIQS